MRSSSARQCYICISYLRLRCSNYFHFPRIAPGSDSALKVQNVNVCAEITWFDNTLTEQRDELLISRHFDPDPLERDGRSPTPIKFK